MEVSWPQLKPYIESAPFLSDTEKEMLLDIFPHLPKSSLGDLLEALHFGLENLANVPPDHLLPPPRSGARPVEHYVQAKPVAQDAPSSVSQGRPAPVERTDEQAEHANLRDLLRRLEGETVNFAKTAPRPAAARPASSASLRPQPATALKAPLPPQPRPSPPVPPPRSGAGPAVKYKPVESLASSAELARVTLGQLRQGDFGKSLLTLHNKLVEIANKENTLLFATVRFFETSPVNQLFLKTGLNLMDDTAKDRPAVFARVRQAMQAQYRESFSPPEFEMYVDFKDKLEQQM